ncbi:MAG TPA: hypothetical protein VJ772_00990 [Nitrososphaeraceae archaeon]|nr:hypothetical protein [Nitrososphaeraceae archaeon]
MYTLVVERKYDSKKSFFGLCESCYWTATILRKVEHYECPVCKSPEIALIPISQNEKYEYDLNSKQGLQVRFSVKGLR